MDSSKRLLSKREAKELLKAILILLKSSFSSFLVCWPCYSNMIIYYNTCIKTSKLYMKIEIGNMNKIEIGNMNSQ